MNRKVYLYDEALLNLSKIKWFCNVGAPLEVTIKTSLALVIENDFDVAIEAILSDEWDDIILERQNLLSEYLAFRCTSEYQSWNKVVRRAKTDSESTVEIIRNSLATIEYPEELLPTITANILGYLTEAAFSFCNPPIFFGCLINVYQAGHLPVGWQGDAVTGKLVVY